MDKKKVSIKIIVAAIEDYYKGTQIKNICETYGIEPSVFNHWLAEYKHIAIEFLALKIENERLRNMLVDFIVNRPVDNAENIDNH